MPHPQQAEVIAKAPGKIIVSGEHSVVYGAPAIATAVDVFATCSAYLNNEKPGLTVELSDFALTKRLDWQEAQQQYQQLKNRYHQYLSGALAIGEVAENPEGLIIYALIHSFDKLLYNYSLSLRIHSDIPIGAGMGSSAAITASVLNAVSSVTEIELDDIQNCVHEVENIQHGKSSGLDPAMVCKGGTICWKNGEAFELDISSDLDSNQWFVVNSGVPVCSTGECVEQVKQGFEESPFWDEFEKVTEQIIAEIESSNSALLKEHIQKNHQLLCDIGVVPNRVQKEIEHLQQQGFAAKITGAGAVRGDNAGMVLIYSEAGTQPPLVFDQLPQPLRFYSQGVYIDS